MPDIKSILVIEDQSGPREAFEFALEETLPSLAPDAEVVYATNIEAARAAIQLPKQFDVIFLDHRLPLWDLGDLEERDFDRFSASLRNVGYELIPEIREKQPESLLVGTSSMKGEIGKLEQKLDASIDKNSLYEPEKEFAPILRAFVQK